MAGTPAPLLLPPCPHLLHQVNLPTSSPHQPSRAPSLKGPVLGSVGIFPTAKEKGQPRPSPPQAW